MSAYRPSPAPLRRRARLLAGCAVAAAIGHPALAQNAFQANGVVVQGSASINPGQTIPGGVRDRVQVFSPQVVINWTPTDTATGGGPIAILGVNDELGFVANPNSLPGGYTVLNRIVPNDASRAILFEGLVSSAFDTGYGATSPGGSIWFYSPGGIIAGANSRFDVGSLVLTANDINFSNGLFADGNANAQTGTIAFRGAANSNAFVTIRSGAQIEAAGSYVALVAPRIQQAGTITVDGSAALVAGASVDMRIPVAGGLFDIFVYDQQRTDAPPGTIFEHSGTTQTSSSAGAGDNRRVYMVAVPKNDAVTMLVSGTVGYQSATGVDLDNGRIILTTGPGVSSQDNIFESGSGRTSIVGGTFNADVLAFGGGAVNLDTSLAPVSFIRDALLTSGTGTVTATARDARNIDAGGTLRLRLSRQSTTSSISMTANAGSTISATAIDLDGEQEDETGYGGPAQGRPLFLSANGGIIQAVESITLNSTASGGNGNSSGGSGQGGTIAVSASAGGSIAAGSLFIDASATGGETGYGAGGAGTGGSISMIAAGGATIAADTIELAANGEGGFGRRSSGSGTGGAITLNFANAGLSTQALGINAFGRSASTDSESGYGSTGSGGGGTGGTVNLLLTGATASLGNVSINVAGTAASGLFDVMGGTGGTATVTANGGTLNLTTMQIVASGLGGAAADFPRDVTTGGAGTGGTITMAFGNLSIAGTALSARADGIGGGAEDGGAATGGTVSLTASAGATIAMSEGLALVAEAVGGSGQDVGGAATGGTVSLIADGGTVSTGVSQLLARAFGGQAASTDDGEIPPPDEFGAEAGAAAGGIAGPGGTATGGIITLAARAGGSAALSGELLATARGGDGFGESGGGNATGGTIALTAAGGTLDVSGGAITVLASGTAGVSAPVGNAPTGRGGTIDVRVSGDTGALRFGALDLIADGEIAVFEDPFDASNSGIGVGGTASVSLAGGNLSGDALRLSASGRGGKGSTGVRGGTGYQGRAVLAISGGSMILTEDLSLRADAFGGSAFPESGYGDGGIGGDAGIGTNPFGTGAGSFVSLTGGSLRTPALLVSSDATGAVGGDSFGDVDAGAGGAARGGSASFASSGAAAIDIGNLTVSAVALGGVGGPVAPEGSSDANGGAGGGAEGGQASASLGGSGAHLVATLLTSAAAEAGAGGSIDRDFTTGVGGSGGIARGGSATIAIGTTLAQTSIVEATANAIGGTGGNGRIGGAGGDTLGGGAAIAFTGGTSAVSRILARADGVGGDAGASFDGNGAIGGAGSSGVTALSIGGIGTSISAFEITLDSRGEGGSGGSAGAIEGQGGDGGIGGAGTGNAATITVTDGSLTVASEGALSLQSEGNGGDGGDAAFDGENIFGFGGVGGSATGGTATLRTTGGRTDSVFTRLNATAISGGGGLGLVGDEIGRAESGASRGGSVLVSAADGGRSAILGLGRALLNADAFGGNEDELGDHIAGQIAITNSGADTDGGIRFVSLDARAIGALAGLSPAISVTATNGPITGTESATLRATGRIVLSASGAGGLRTAGGVSITSDSADILIDHGARGGATLAGGDIDLFAATVFTATPASLIAATGDVRIGAGQSASIGSLIARNASIEAGYGGSGLDATIAGAVALTGNLDVSAGRDAIIDTGAQVIADGAIRVLTGDDIIVRSGALLRAANDPPAETGYGAGDPKAQQTQMRLYAGFFENEQRAGEVASLLIDGAIESPTRTMQLEAGAIQGSTASRLVAGNLFVRINDIPEGAPSDDFGQLAAPCLQGNVCLGNVNAAGVVQIGESGFEPVSLRLNGGIDATDVTLRALDDIRLGVAGANNVIRASQSLDIFAVGGDIIGEGPVAIFGGTELASLAAGGQIAGQTIDISAPGTLNIYAPGDIRLNAVTAQQLQTLTPQGALLNGGGITTAGVIAIGSLATASDTLIDGAGGVTLGTAALGDRALAVRSNGAVVLGTIDAGSIAADTPGALSFAVLRSTTGAIALGGTTRAATITGGSASAGGALTARASGSITADALSAGGALHADTAGGNIVLGSAVSTGPGTFIANNGTITVSQNASAGGGITATARAIDLTGANGLTVTAATATAGDLRLRTIAGNLSAGTSSATGNVVLASGGAAGFTSLTAGGTTAISAVGDISGGTLSSAGLATLSSSNGVTRVDNVAAAPNGIIASGTGVSLGAAGGLNVLRADASAGELALTTRAGPLIVGTARATGAMTLTAAGALRFDTLAAGGALAIAAQGAIDGGSATASTIAITTPATIVANDLIATAGGLSVTADRGITLDSAISTGITTLRAAQGTIRVASDIRAGQGIVIAAPSVDLTAQNGLFIVQADATAGDLTLRTIAGDLIAGNSSATGAITLTSAGALSFGTLTARQGIAMTAAGAIDGRLASGASLNATGTRGIVIDRIASGGAVTLGASAGAIRVASDITAGGPIQATAQALSLSAIGDLALSQGTATAGDLVLTSGGAITIGQASASNALTATAATAINVNGAANGTTIAFTSRDIAVGGSAQIGSVTQTASVTLTSTADRTFIGGADAGTGYRLGSGEVARIAARDTIRIVGVPQSRPSEAFTFTDPAEATMVMEALTLDGGQLGPNGTFTIESPRSIGAVGFAQFRNFANGQSVLLNAATDISLAAENGLVTLKDSAGGLAGTLELRAQQVTALTAAARRDVPNLTLNEVRQRLGTPDGIQNDGGFAQAGNIIVRIGRLIFIQNTGGPAIEERRGFTAGQSMTIQATGETPVQIVINGRVGNAVGADLAESIRFIGPFDPASTFSNCTFGGQDCSGSPQPEPFPITDAIFASSRDQLQSEEDEDEKEEALKAAQTRPDPIIQLARAPTSRFDPLIDEPITGAGNEDLWEGPPPPLSPSP